MKIIVQVVSRYTRDWTILRWSFRVSSGKFRGKTRRNEISRLENIEREERRIIFHPRYRNRHRHSKFPDCCALRKVNTFFFLENYAIAYFHKYIITYMLTARSQIIEWKLVDSLSPRKTGIVGGISAEPRVYWICSTFFFLIFPWKSNPILVVEASAPHFLVSCFFFFAISRGIREYIRGNGFGSRRSDDRMKGRSRNIVTRFCAWKGTSFHRSIDG